MTRPHAPRAARPRPAPPAADVTQACAVASPRPIDPARSSAPAEPAWGPALAAIRGAYADATVKGYASALRVFQRWCDREGLQAMPAAPETVARFIVDWSTRSTPDSMVQKLSAIRLAHRILGFPDPISSIPVKLARQRLRRQRPQGMRQALGITPSLRDRLLGACGDDLIGRRDRALVRLGFDTLCRGSELGALRIEDIEPEPGGTARILVRRSKSDIAGRGAWAYLSQPALRDVAAWLEASRLASGPVLRRMSWRKIGPGQMSAEAITERLRRLARSAGFPEDVIARLSSHSFRVGAVQELAATGGSLLDIMRAGRWGSLDAVAGYLRELAVNPWGENATGPDRPRR